MPETTAPQRPSPSARHARGWRASNSEVTAAPAGTATFTRPFWCRRGSGGNERSKFSDKQGLSPLVIFISAIQRKGHHAPRASRARARQARVRCQCGRAATKHGSNAARRPPSLARAFGHVQPARDPLLIFLRLHLICHLSLLPAPRREAQRRGREWRDVFSVRPPLPGPTFMQGRKRSSP